MWGSWYPRVCQHTERASPPSPYRLGMCLSCPPGSTLVCIGHETGVCMSAARSSHCLLAPLLGVGCPVQSKEAVLRSMRSCSIDVSHVHKYVVYHTICRLWCYRVAKFYEVIAKKLQSSRHEQHELGGRATWWVPSTPCCVNTLTFNPLTNTLLVSVHVVATMSS